MKNILTNFKLPAIISFALMIPFVILELINRRSFNEDFPFILFFGLWLNLFAVILILLPIMRAMRTENRDMSNPVPTQGDTLHLTTKSILITGLVIVLFIAIVPLLNSLDWGTLVPSQFIAFAFLFLPIALGITAAKPVVRTLRAGGSLFAHPLHLILVVMISFFFAMSVISLIIDQWPCFMGVPNCD